MEQDNGVSVERVRVPRNSFKPNRVNNPLPPALRAKPIEVRFGAGGTLGDLVQALSASDIQIGFEFNEIIESNIQVGSDSEGGSGGRTAGGAFGSGSGLGTNSGFGRNGLNNGYGSNGLNSSGFYGSNGTGYGSQGYGSQYGSNFGSGNMGGGLGSGMYGSNSMYGNGYGNSSAFGGTGFGASGNSAFGNRSRTGSAGTGRAGAGAGGMNGAGQRVDRQEVMLQRRLPFTRYSGTVGGLVDSLRKGLGIVMSYENGMVFISDREKYSVILPQNEEVIQTVTAEIRGLGGEGIVPSLRGGQILYSASPTIQDTVIRPYLDRLARNMAVINVQAAVVSVALTDTTSTGFDWAKFQVALEGRQSRLNPSTNTTTTTTPANGSNSTVNPTTGQPTCATCKVTGSPLDSAGLQQVDAGTVIDLTKTGLVLGKTAMGNYFGTYGALSVASAINFLSEFGNTKIDQNVQLKTLSGTDVKFRSGQIVPYVSGVAATAGYNNNVTGSSATDKVDTGLTVVMTPLYDADTQLVTMNVNLSLKSILQYVQLNAGNQLGTFSQPLVQDQELTDIVRTPAGRTIVIGGLQIDNEQFNGSEPVGLRNIFAQAGSTPDILSGRAQTIKRDALFVILRPTVTVFVPEGR